MKIAIIVRGFHKQGGISRCAVELSNYLSLENEVHVFTNYFESDNEKLIYHPVKPYVINFIDKLKMASEFISFAVKANLMLKKYKFDIIHSHSSSCFKQDIVTAHSCHKASIVKFLKLNNKSNIVNNAINIYLNPFNLANVFIENKQYTKGNYKNIIALSNNMKNELIEYYNIREEDIHVIPNGVNLKQFCPDKLIRGINRNKYGFREEDFVISFVCSRFKNKGLTYLMNALNLLKNNNIKLLIVSGDDVSPYLKYAANLGILGQIVVYGATKTPEDAFRTSDMFCLPSYYEGFALVILEAMACGLPVITSDVGGARDLIKNGDNGIIIDRFPDVKCLAGLINYLYRNESKRNNISISALESAKKYTWDNISKKTYDLYKKTKIL